MGCAINEPREQEWVDLNTPTVTTELQAGKKLGDIKNKDFSFSRKYHGSVDITRDTEFFFQNHPKKPTTPPMIDQRHEAFDPNRENPPHYGVDPLLPDVPVQQKFRAPYPQDYAGVARWNRWLSEPNGPANLPQYSKFSKSGHGDVSSSPYYDADDAWYLKAGRATGNFFSTMGSAVVSEDEDISSFKLGPIGTFATNFMDVLRGGSLSLGLEAVAIRNRWAAFETWAGYRRVLFGITGESKEIYTMDNVALGISYGILPYHNEEQHLRILGGIEFNYNLTTETAAAGTSPTYVGGINFFGLGAKVTWDEDMWGVFGRYLFVPRALTEEYSSFLHIAEIGLSFYVF